MDKSESILLHRIVDVLLLNGSLVESSGLIHGKMGIAIFFFHYGRYTGNELFEEYAMDLIGEIQEQIQDNVSPDYGDGLAGIGVGIDYLARNGFLELENDVLEDVDQLMYRTVMYTPSQNFSFYHGLTGYARYWASRFETPEADQALRQILEQISQNINSIPEPEQWDVFSFLSDLNGWAAYANKTENLLAYCHARWPIIRKPQEAFQRLGHSRIGERVRNYLCCSYLSIDFGKSREEKPSWDMKQEEMGLLNGYAGEGLCLLSNLNPKDIAWIGLL
jgi:hypothetical protein